MSRFRSTAVSDALSEPLILLAGFGDRDAAELCELLAPDCRVTRVRSAVHAATVLCLGPLLSSIEVRHLISESQAAVLLTSAGPEPAMFQDLIDADRLFYLSPGAPRTADLAALVRAALERRTDAKESPASALLPALDAARRLATQPDLASAGELLQRAAEEAIDADRIYCLLYDPAGEILWSRTPGVAAGERHESPAVGLVSFVARTGRVVRIERAFEDPRFERDADDPAGAHCGHLLAVPVAETTVLAVLCAVRDSGRAPFSAADEAALVVLADTVAPSLAQLATMSALEARGRSAKIFRDEAVEHHAAAGARVEGDWLRLSPRWLSATFWLLAALVVAFVLFAAVGTLDEHSTGVAVVRLTGRTEVTAMQTGRVIAVDVKPGDRVSAGEVMVRFDSAAESAELARIEREWELQLVERLRDLSAAAPAQALIALRAERDLARFRVGERVVRAPKGGIVGDLRCHADQHVSAGDILLSLNGADARPALTVLLPGEHRPLLRPGMRLNLELRGYAHAPQHLTIASVSEDVVGPEEAKRLVGAEVAAAVPLSGPLVRVEAFFPRDTFDARGERYALHDGMWGTADVPVRSESLLVALVPGLRALSERLHG